MDRRELLKMVATLTGGVIIGGEVFLSGCVSHDAKTALGFSEEDIAFLDEIAETILPRTKTPGAKDAAVGRFMTVMVNDCYEPGDQQIFHEGMKQVKETSKKKYNEDFMKMSPEKKHDLLVILDNEAKEYQKSKKTFDEQEEQKRKDEEAKGNMNFVKEKKPAHYFTMMKQLVLLGFFTSKPGANEALRFVAVPGRYEACIPYKKGDRAWA